MSRETPRHGIITSFRRRQSSNPGLVVSLFDVSFNNNRCDFAVPPATENLKRRAYWNVLLHTGRSRKGCRPQVFLRTGLATSEIYILYIYI